MKNLTILASMMLAVLMISCNQAGEDQDGKKPADGMFIHLSSGEENAHRALMAMKMAEVMSSDKDVLMYLDIEAVKLVVSEAPDVQMEGFESSLRQIRKLLDAGVSIQACPTCLKLAGYAEEDLQSGVILANKEKFFNFTEGRILTIDY
jgi:predicted peroxiredoxin